jgi:glycine/D-amino acid oxidase-like deaminating enzyme
MSTDATMTHPIQVDPGLPRDGPTKPLWQEPAHPLANISSTKLQIESDVVIIGSGMSGCSVAKTLLEISDVNVTVLEARGLASGASSRNGGHIVSSAVSDFQDLSSAFGVEAAAAIAEFTLQNVDKTFEMVDQLGEDLKAFSKIRRTEKIIGYTDSATFAHAKENVDLWNREMPHRRDCVRLVDASEAKAAYGLINVVGAMVGVAAAVWPYRLWCGVWQHLVEQFKDRLAIETHTPALSVAATGGGDGSACYIVNTPRGDIRATHVVYCTNGYTSHLLPSLRGKLFPLRGTMSAQDLGESLPNQGAHRSWSTVGQSYVDADTDARSAGLYYLTQDPDSGFMMLGGEHDKPEIILTSDDRELNPTSAEKLVEFLPRHFEGAAWPEVKNIWSGIMGFSKDGLPLLGNLPRSLTCRDGQKEWIAAGFCGYGTGYCLSCGQAVAEMILGRDVSEWVPKPLMISEERYSGSLTHANAWEGLLGPVITCDTTYTTLSE